MSFRTLSLVSTLLLGTFLVAFATPAQAVDIDCRQDVQLFCLHGSDFCLVWINNPSAWACIGTHTVEDVTDAIQVRAVTVCAPGALGCTSTSAARALLP